MHHHIPPAPERRQPADAIVVLLGPYLSILAGALAAWLSHNFPGLADVDGDAAAITQALTFVTGTGVTWALHHKYLDGSQKWQSSVLDAHRALAVASASSEGQDDDDDEPLDGDEAADALFGPAR